MSDKKKPVAFVSMPWQNFYYPSMGISVLKGGLARRRIAADAYYFNLNFAHRIGMDLYDRFMLHSDSDLLFSISLFGGEKDGALKRMWEQLQRKLPFEENIRIAQKDSSCLADFKEFQALAYSAVPEFIEDCLETTDWGKYAIVGFSSACAMHMASLNLAKRIKERFPGVYIILGGPGMFGEMGHALLEGAPWLDYVANGEADDSFPELVENILAGRPYEKIPGISYRSKTRVHLSAPAPTVDIDRLPFPDHDDFYASIQKIPLFNLFKKLIWMETARGCWWAQKNQCRFCSQCHNRNYQSKKPERAIKEISHLVNRYKRVSLYLTDTSMRFPYVKALYSKLRPLDMDVDFVGTAFRPGVTRAQVEQIKGFGFKKVYFGIEALDTEILRLMRKGSTAIHNVCLLKWGRELDILLYWGMIYGIPGENPEIYAKMLQRLPSLTHLQPPVNIQPFLLLKYSPYYEQARQFGITRIAPIPIYKIAYPEDQFDLKRLAYRFNYSVSGFHVSPETYMAPIKDFVQFWKEKYQANQTYLFYERGLEFLRFYDSRLRSPSDRSGPDRRIFEFSEDYKSVYKFCENDIRSAQEISQQIKMHSNRKISPRAVSRMLEELLDKGLVYAEEGRFVGLALPKKAYNEDVLLRATQDVL